MNKFYKTYIIIKNYHLLVFMYRTFINQLVLINYLIKKN